VAAPADAVPKGFERAPCARRFDSIRAKCGGDGIAKLLQRTPEHLATRLELGS
jgi:hypothetical protein